VRKEPVLEIRRRCGRAKPVVYQIMDKPPPKKSAARGRPRLCTAALRGRLFLFRCAFSDDRRCTNAQDWARVVAVFVQGALWQFRDFPFKARSRARVRCAAKQVFD
jgi:hypothetical protein